MEKSLYTGKLVRRRSVLKRYVKSALQPNKTKYFLIKDLDAEIEVIETTRKELLDYLDQYIDNLKYDWFDGSDESFGILYSDGTEDSVDVNYDGHHVRRTGIVSVVYDNPANSMCYGPYCINQYGVVSTSNKIQIDRNIEEIRS